MQNHSITVKLICTVFSNVEDDEAVLSISSALALHTAQKRKRRKLQPTSSPCSSLPPPPQKNHDSGGILPAAAAVIIPALLPNSKVGHSSTDEKRERGVDGETKEGLEVIRCSLTPHQRSWRRTGGQRKGSSSFIGFLEQAVNRRAFPCRPPLNWLLRFFLTLL
jgi:hypothetical protein